MLSLRRYLNEAQTELLRSRGIPTSSYWAVHETEQYLVIWHIRDRHYEIVMKQNSPVSGSAGSPLPKGNLWSRDTSTRGPGAERCAWA